MAVNDKSTVKLSVFIIINIKIFCSANFINNIKFFKMTHSIIYISLTVKKYIIKIISAHLM